MKLKKILIPVAIILVLIFAAYRFFAGNYNAIVAKDEEVSSQWAQVQNQYQRRMDLIPNLVATVKGYASHEEDVLKAVSEARSRAGGVVNVDSNTLENPEEFKKFQAAQDSLSSSLQRLLVVTENYPELKANENFLSLQSQLEGTENRISVERKRYNDTAKDFNVFIRQFPRSIIANMNGFRTKSYFEAAAEAQTAPQVRF